jgi:hypothetical protein
LNRDFPAFHERQHGIKPMGRYLGFVPGAGALYPAVFAAISPPVARGLLAFYYPVIRFARVPFQAIGPPGRVERSRSPGVAVEDEPQVRRIGFVGELFPG